MRFFRRFNKQRIFIILCLIVVSVNTPSLLLSSHRLRHLGYDASKEFVGDLAILKHKIEVQALSAVQQEEVGSLKEPILDVYRDGNQTSAVSLDTIDKNDTLGQPKNVRLVGNDVTTHDAKKESLVTTHDATVTTHDTKNESSVTTHDAKNESSVTTHDAKKESQPSLQEKTLATAREKALEKSRLKEIQHGQNVHSHPRRVLDERVKEIKDQLIRAKAYLNFVPAGGNSNFMKEIKLRIKELERAAGDVSKDSDLSRRAIQKMKAMRSTLSKASKMFPECSAMVKKLRAMTYNAEEQLRSHKNQASFLVNLAGRTTPKGLHCLSMRLTTEYFALQPEEQELPNQHKFQNPDLHHFAVFSDNVLACSAVVNSTVSTSTAPEKIVFHIVTDSLNLPAMTMWFLLNPPGKATIQIQSIDSFDWLSNKDILQNQESLDPRYTSPLNHLRFYLPDIFPSLNKIVLLDHDVVVKRDLSGLWRINMKGKVNGAVETCLEGDPSFRQMDMLINFTDPMVATKFDMKSCTWAFGMNIFDLQDWRKRNLTGLYHKYLKLGSNRPLMKAGTLPIGWMTFYKHTRAIDRRWHVLGLGYDSGVKLSEIEQAAVIHYDGVMKPWLEVGIQKFKPYWKKHVRYEHPFVQRCNIHD
ncbi:putative galacturonosyltransferase 5 [Capsicum baccatum]|uniref:Hexosyltransferase n=1 Tax=Capsicum baccatum TaxID=33114 RepID=A0A2G2WAT3_CAPBA|nr:putative galacturonosyltransferase 5 [Capsicum baccatum]